MDERDIFDEEYDRINGQQSDFNSAFNNWSNYNTPPQQPKQNKSLRIVLTAVLMVFCLVFGWALGSVTSTPTTPSTGNDSKDVLDSVIDFMNYNFYEEIDEETWQLAVEQAGIALLQYAGDRYTFLMSPQSYYDYMHKTTTTTTVGINQNEVFGMTFSFGDKGLTVSSVVTDSASYGRLREDDLIVKMTDILEYKVENGFIKYNTIDGVRIPETTPATNDYVFEGKTQLQVSGCLQYVYSATFHVLRDGEITQIPLTRNTTGIKAEKTEQKRYDFNFVEYYFSDDVTNISIENQNGAGTNTKTERGLGDLTADVGYIHLTQFDKTDKTTCYAEMATAMDLFAKSGCKRLILDLKGNPGGYVDYAVDIAGLFINADNLTTAQQSSLISNKKHHVTSLVDRNGKTYSYGAESSYRNYFKAEDDDGKKRIIVWTDGGSASASELLTGALLDYGTAVQMGKKSYGKGIAQTITELDITGAYTDLNEIVHKTPVKHESHTDGVWAVYYTFAKYYSPLGKNIHDVGYTPIADYTASNYADLVALAKAYWA